MVTKKIAVFLLLTLAFILSLQIVYAGCCVGVTGCNRAFDAGECMSTAPYDPLERECEEMDECRVGICCHDDPALLRSMHQITCDIGYPSSAFTPLSGFMSNPTSFESQANTYCLPGALPSCTYSSCEQENPVPCRCGLTNVDPEASPFCCANDNLVFSSIAACQISSCAAAAYVSISGKIYDQGSDPVEGATVRAGGKQTVTDGTGFYRIPLLPVNSQGTVIVTKGSDSNATSYDLGTVDLVNFNLYIFITIAEILEEDCGVAGDQDNDQFGGGGVIPLAKLDACDADCGVVDFTVLPAFYHDTEVGFCADNIDNDCDGDKDLDDSDCELHLTECGDLAVQFPNSQGVFEQCDRDYSTGEGEDARCPGLCNSSSCMCTYAKGCGNNIIDEPEEDCDGLWDPIDKKWKNPAAVQGPCGASCFTPLDAKPCTCPQTNICGDGNLQYPPEQCEYLDSAYEDGDRTKALINPADAEFAPGLGCDRDVPIPCNPNCQCVLTPTCGNGILESGEDCEGTWNPGVLYHSQDPLILGDSQAGSWDVASFKTNKFGCTPTRCGAKSDTKQTLVTITGEGIDGSRIEEIDECTCPFVCDLNPPGPNITDVKPVRFKADMTITWTDMCPNNVLRYFVYRCTDPDCVSSKTIVSGELPPTAREFVDKDVEPRTSVPLYCYMIEGVYETTTIAERTKRSQIVCIEPGDQECFDMQNPEKGGREDATQICAADLNNIRSTCDEDTNFLRDLDREDPNEVDPSHPFVDCSHVDFNFDGEEDVEPGFCIELTDGTTRCIPKAVCDACSDPLGLFSFSRHIPQTSIPISRNYGRSEGYSRDFSSTGIMPCYELAGCFLDYSRVSVDRFMPIKLDFSCYDYQSEMACNEDVKQLSNCEWINATRGYYHQVGFGVCRPTSIDDEDCSRCHDPLNKVFGKCGDDTCWLYGHCYYDRDNRLRGYSADNISDYYEDEVIPSEYYHICKHMYEISCEDFDTEEDCVDSSGAYSRGGTEQLSSAVEVDVTGELIIHTFNKEDGTNVQTNFSDDYFNYSKCTYASRVTLYGDGFEEISKEGCRRNADFNPPDTEEIIDESYPAASMNITDSTMGNDCPTSMFNPTLLSCQRDFQNPNTTISYPDKVSASFELEAFVNDDMELYAPTIQADTYSCIVPNNYEPCYPTGLADKEPLNNIISWNNTAINYTSHSSEGFAYPSYDPGEGLTTGFYDLYFFSEDYANNLEVIQMIDLFIDASPPDVEILFTNISWELFEDIWRTNLSMEMNIINPEVTMDEIATCTAMLQNENEDEMYPLLTINDELNNTWNRTYTYLEDGYYYFYYHCEDDVGNVAEDSILLWIDGDKSVTNPQPRGVLNYADDITISVESAKQANCKYLKSYDDLDDFNSSEEFGVDEFNSVMTDTFSFTGGITHNSLMGRLDSGYHRFYVKCLFPDENKVIGSKADQIRFAVDVEPPATFMYADMIPYQDWYNDDIKVSLTCGDPAIIDTYGMPWQFGCEDTQYCIGNDCGFFQDYSAPFTLVSSTNITFFSWDLGNNTEGEQTLEFLIDKIPPNLTIEILEPGDIPAEFVRLDLPYKIKLTSDKPLISPAVAAPFVFFTSSPQKFSQEIIMFPTLDPYVWEGLLRLKNINENRGFEGDGILEVVAADHHNVSGTTTLTFLIDTKPPTPPILRPSIEDPYPEDSEYIMEDYPLKYNNGTYYTNDGRLFLTGYTDELLDMVLVQSSEGIPKEFRFTQFETTEIFSDKAISGAGHKIRIEGDLTEEISNELFIGFGNTPTPSDPKITGPRRDYQNYGIFYDITSVTYIQGYLGADQYTEITLYEPLDDPLSELSGKPAVYFYDRSVPSYWFGINLDLEENQNNDVLMFVYDEARNIARYPPTPSVFTFFFDPVAPTLSSHYPFPGTTSQTTLPIDIRVQEGTDESGIDESAINLTLTDEAGIEIPLIYSFELEAEGEFTNTYLIHVDSTDYEDGAYTVKLYLEDWAGNKLNNNATLFSWTFTVDSKAPPRPEFKLVNGNSGPYIEPNTGQPMRWFTQEDTPQFTLDFDEDDPVTIEDMAFVHAPTGGEIASCIKELGTNKFTCDFDDFLGVPFNSAWMDYGITVYAFKTLDDGSTSSTVEYGPYDFTIDQQAPIFDMNFNHRIRDDFNLKINASVMNEGHPLHGTFDILGEPYALAMTNMEVGALFERIYSFVWPVPKLSRDLEGNHDLTITLSDYAGNAATEPDNVYIDLTPPEIRNLSLDISKILTIGNQYFTRFANVTISGEFKHGDVMALWVEPGTFNLTSETYDARTFGKINYDEFGNSTTFSINLQLRGEEGAEILNDMTIFVQDIAGHRSFFNLNVWRDLKAPDIPTFCISPSGKCPTIPFQ